MTTCAPSPYCPSRAIASGGFGYAAQDTRPLGASVLVGVTPTDPGYYVYPTAQEGATIPVPNPAGTAVLGYAANNSDCADAASGAATNVTFAPVNNVTVEPPVNNVTVEPPVNNFAPVNNVTVEPPVNNVTVEPPVNNFAPVNNVTVEPPVNNVTVEPPVNNVTVEPPVNNFAPVNNVTVEPPANNITVQPAPPATGVVDTFTAADGAIFTVAADGTETQVRPPQVPACGAPVPTGDFACFAGNYQMKMVDACGAVTWAVQGAQAWTATGAERCVAGAVEAQEEDQCGHKRWAATVRTCYCPSVRLPDGGFIFHPTDLVDPAATVSIEDCSAVVLGLAFASAGLGHTTPIYECVAGAPGPTIVGYAANTSACAPDCGCPDTDVVVYPAPPVVTISGGLTCADVVASATPLCAAGLVPDEVLVWNATTCKPETSELRHPGHDMTTFVPAPVSIAGLAFGAAMEAAATCSPITARHVWADNTWVVNGVTGDYYFGSAGSAPGFGFSGVITLTAGEVVQLIVQANKLSFLHAPPVVEFGADTLVGGGWREVGSVDHYQVSFVSPDNSTYIYTAVVAKTWTGRIRYRAPYYTRDDGGFVTGWGASVEAFSGVDLSNPIVRANVIAMRFSDEPTLVCPTVGVQTINHGGKESPCNAVMFAGSVRHGSVDAFDTLTGQQILHEGAGTASSCTASLGVVFNTTNTTFNVHSVINGPPPGGVALCVARDAVISVEYRAAITPGVSVVFSDTANLTVTNGNSCATGGLAAQALASYTLLGANVKATLAPNSIYEVVQVVGGKSLATTVMNPTTDQLTFNVPMNTFADTIGSLVAPGGVVAPITVSVSIRAVRHVEVATVPQWVITPGVYTLRTDHV